MKNKLFIICITLLSIILGVHFLNAASMKPFAYLFIGRWQPAEDPLLIDENGFQDIQNLRKDGKRLKGVSGHTKINTTALATYQYVRNGFHFRKEQLAQTYLLPVRRVVSLHRKFFTDLE